MKLKRLSLPILLVIIFLWAGPLWSQVSVSRRKHEIGASVDTFAALPGTEWEAILQPNIGFGLYYRLNWPWILNTELGMGWSFLESRSAQSLIIVPFYTALNYRLPLKSRIDIFTKLGTGSSYVEVRPANVHGWDPLFLLGLELSILASRSLRIGVRLDYFLIYEKHLKAPQDVRHPPPIPDHVDERYQNQQDFRITNGHFLRFAILVGGVF